MLHPLYKTKRDEKESASVIAFESGITLPTLGSIKAENQLTIENQTYSIGFSGTYNVGNPVVKIEERDLPFTQLMTDDPYFSSRDVESSTAPLSRPIQVDEEFKSIIEERMLDVENYDEDLTNNNIIEWIEKYGKYALDTIFQYYRTGSLKDSLLSEILISVGQVNSYWSYNGRVGLLEYFLQDNSPKIRYGAIVGFSYINSKESFLVISTALKKEKIPILKNILKSVLNELLSE